MYRAGRAPRGNEEAVGFASRYMYFPSGENTGFRSTEAERVKFRRLPSLRLYRKMSLSNRYMASKASQVPSWEKARLYPSKDQNSASATRVVVPAFMSCSITERLPSMKASFSRFGSACRLLELFSVRKTGDSPALPSAAIRKRLVQPRSVRV